MTKEFKKLHEVEDADEINNIKGNAFEAWSDMVFMIVSDKRKIWGIDTLFIHSVRN